MSDILDRLRELGVTKGFSESFLVKSKGDTEVFLALQKTFPDGVVVQNDYGPVFINRVHYPLNYRHGVVTLDYEITASELFTQMIGIPNIEKMHALAMDTETSSLTYGASGFIFMIGLGYYTEEDYIVDQLILPDLGYEKPFIRQIELEFAKFPLLLTYNGKGFDLPMIRSRASFHQFPDFCSAIQHVDLLSVARKYWKKNLDNRCLSTIESEVLQITRGSEEIPGYMAPELYRAYLNENDAVHIKGVAYHNEIDVLSLNAFLIFLNDLAAKAELDVGSIAGSKIRIPDLLRELAICGNNSLNYQQTAKDYEADRNERMKLWKTLHREGQDVAALEVLCGLADDGDNEACYQAACMLARMADLSKAEKYVEQALTRIIADETILPWSKQMKLEKYQKLLGRIKAKRNKS